MRNIIILLFVTVGLQAQDVGHVSRFSLSSKDQVNINNAIDQSNSNVTNISSNDTDIATNATNITSNDTDITTLNSRVDSLQAKHLFIYFGDSTVSKSYSTSWAHFTNATDSVFIQYE